MHKTVLLEMTAKRNCDLENRLRLAACAAGKHKTHYVVNELGGFKCGGEMALFY